MGTGSVTGTNTLSGDHDLVLICAHDIVHVIHSHRIYGSEDGI